LSPIDSRISVEAKADEAKQAAIRAVIRVIFFMVKLLGVGLKTDAKKAWRHKPSGVKKPDAEAGLKKREKPGTFPAR
jgi:hypothetical protein